MCRSEGKTSCARPVGHLLCNQPKARTANCPPLSSTLFSPARRPSSCYLWPASGGCSHFLFHSYFRFFLHSLTLLERSLLALSLLSTAYQVRPCVCMSLLRQWHFFSRSLGPISESVGHTAVCTGTLVCQTSPLTFSFIFIFLSYYTYFLSFSLFDRHLIA